MLHQLHVKQAQGRNNGRKWQGEGAGGCAQVNYIGLSTRLDVSQGLVQVPLAEKSSAQSNVGRASCFKYHFASVIISAFPGQPSHEGADGCVQVNDIGLRTRFDVSPGLFQVPLAEKSSVKSNIGRAVFLNTNPRR